MPEESEVDIIFSKIGLGRWQLVQFFWLILLYFPWAGIFLGIVIIGYVPDFACSPPSNESFLQNTTDAPIFDNQCSTVDPITNVSEQCQSGYIYAVPKHASIVSEWDLVCGQNFLSELSQTVLTVGHFVGAIVFPPLADKYGRRHIFIWNHAGFLLSAIGTAFVPNISLFILLRGLTGMFGSGAGMISWVVTLELFTPKHRTIAAVASGIFWGICVCTVPLIGYLMDGQNWRHLHLMFSAYAIIWIGQFITIPESVRWLLANGKRQEALQIIKKASKTNGLDPIQIDELITDHFPGLEADEVTQTRTNGNTVDIDDIKYQMVAATYGQILNRSSKNVSAPDKVAKATLLDIFRHPALRKAAVITGFAWFTNSLTYAGLYMLSSEMSGSRYLNLFLNAVVEVPSCIILMPLTMRFGRRTLCVSLHVLAGVSLISAGVINLTLDGTAADIAQKFVTICGKFSITASFMVIFMYTPELYPTNIRIMGTAIADMIGRLGGFIAPFSATVARTVPWAPAMIFGILSILVAISSIFLPETANRELPQALDDLDEGRLKKDKLLTNGGEL